MITLKSFQQQKRQCLSGVDLSRKGSIDEPIHELVSYINKLENYFTTSSCSGRIAVYEKDVDGNKKKGCKWLYISHDLIDIATNELINGLEQSTSMAFFKYEAFVMHVQCWRLEDARRLHAVAVSSGFRNSGISVGRNGKYIVGVRSSLGLEAPVTLDGQLCITDQYLKLLIQLGNSKMTENFMQIEKFFENIRFMVERSIEEESCAASSIVTTKCNNKHKNKKDNLDIKDKSEQCRNSHEQDTNDTVENLEAMFSLPS